MHRAALSILFILASIDLMASAQTYQLVWSDEFNGNSLDTSKWQYEVNCDGGGNDELQCYTASSSNVAVANGSLVVTAQLQNLNGKQYTSGRINTAASAAWKYGRFDISAKLPNGIYLWPALWLLPRDNVYGGWAASGEIDIMENRGGHNSEDQSTLHFGGAWPNNVYQGSGATTLGFDMTTDYHLYSAIWTPESIEFLVDGNVYYSETLQRSFGGMYASNGSPFDQYFFFIINLAVGGDFFGANANSLTEGMAQQWESPSLYVDYVRVYQLQSGGVTPNPVPVPAPIPTTSSTQAVTPFPSTTTSAPSTLAPSTTSAPSALVPPSTTTSAPSTLVSPSTITPNPTVSSGCAAATCGTLSCCKDQNNGPQCYANSIYSCAEDAYTGLNSLCLKGFQACRTACYNPLQYTCTQGKLTSGASPAFMAEVVTPTSLSNTTSEVLAGDLTPTYPDPTSEGHSPSGSVSHSSSFNLVITLMVFVVSMNVL